MLGLQIFRDAIAKIVNNPHDVLRINAPWFAIISLLGLPLLMWPQLADPYAVAPRPMSGMLTDISDFSGLFVLLMLFAALIGTMIVAIGWHRYVIDDELESEWLLSGGNWALGRYFWTGFLLGLIGAALTGLLFFTSISGWSETSDEISNAGYFLSLFTAAFCIALPVHFLGLVLPGIAVDRTMSFRQSLAFTRPHALSILVLTVLVALAFAVPDTLISAFIGPTDYIEASLSGWVAYAIYTIVSWLQMVLAVGVLSELFRRLVTKDEPEGAVG